VSKTPAIMQMMLSTVIMGLRKTNCSVVRFM